MKFRKSKYYNIDFLGRHLHKEIKKVDKLFTVKEFFNIKGTQKEYPKKGESIYEEPYSYKLKVHEDYYELNCQSYDNCFFLLFDKPVHVIGKYCTKIIAPEIVIKSSENTKIALCVTDKAIINNNYKDYYEIRHSNVNTIYFYNSKVDFWYSKVDNFFIFNKDLKFYELSYFSEVYKIKFFGYCKELKEKLLNTKNFKKGIIHIE